MTLSEQMFLAGNILYTFCSSVVELLLLTRLSTWMHGRYGRGESLAPREARAPAPTGKIWGLTQYVHRMQYIIYSNLPSELKGVQCCTVRAEKTQMLAHCTILAVWILVELVAD